MSYLVVVPELVAAAATDLANIGSSISAANAAAAAPDHGTGRSRRRRGIGGHSRVVRSACSGISSVECPGGDVS